MKRDIPPVAVVVDDEPLIADVVGWALEGAGYQVVIASSGAQALEAIKGVAALDILVTDIRMPGRIDGWTLVELVRERLPDVPVVYISGFSPGFPRAVPNSRFLQKPFRPEDLIAAVRDLQAQ